MARKAPIPKKLATGVLLTHDRVIATSMQKTPLGIKRVGSFDIARDDPDVPFDEQLRQLDAAGQLQGRIIVGVDPRSAYGITLKLTADDNDRRAAEILAGRVGYHENEIVAGMQSVKLPGGLHASFSACSRSAAESAMRALSDRKPKSIRLAPVTWVLYDLAVKAASRPRRCKTLIRVLPGEDGGLAMLEHNGSMVASRLFEAPGVEVGRNDQSFAASIGIAALSLLTHGREELGLPSMDRVLLHLGEVDDGFAEAVQDSCGVPCDVVASVTADPESATEALATAGLRSQPTDVNLFDELQPPAGLRQNFPKRAAAVILGATLVLGYLLDEESSIVERKKQHLLLEAEARARSAGVNMPDLRTWHDKLKLEFQHARAFVEKRVFWSELLEEAPMVMPESVTLMDFDGRDIVRFPKKKKPVVSTAQLALSGEVEMDAEATSPPEVSEMTSAIRASPLFQTKLPRITGANVRLQPGQNGLFARIVVNCLAGEG